MHDVPDKPGGVLRGGIKMSEWISVKDRLPEDIGDVLVVAYWEEQ